MWRALVDGWNRFRERMKARQFRLRRRALGQQRRIASFKNRINDHFWVIVHRWRPIDLEHHVVRIVNAVFAKDKLDVPTLRRLVSDDVVFDSAPLCIAPGQHGDNDHVIHGFRNLLPGRDGFLQFANAMRRDSGVFGTIKDKIDINLSKNSDSSIDAVIRVPYERQDVTVGTVCPDTWDYAWSFFFHKSGRLKKISIKDSGSLDSRDRFKYPDVMEEKHVHQSRWSRLCAYFHDATLTFMRLRAIWIVTGIFAYLMLAPDQTKEIWGSEISDNVEKVSALKNHGGFSSILWLLANFFNKYDILSFLFWMAVSIYGVAILAYRRPNEPNHAIGPLRWMIRAFILTLVGPVAFFSALFASTIQAQVSLSAELVYQGEESGLGGSQLIYMLSDHSGFIFSGIFLSLITFYATILWGSTGTFQGDRIPRKIRHFYHWKNFIRSSDTFWKSHISRKAFLFLMGVLTLLAIIAYPAFRHDTSLIVIVIAWMILLLIILGWLVWLSARTRFPFVATLLAILISLSAFNLNHHNIVRFDLLSSKAQSAAHDQLAQRSADKSPKQESSTPDMGYAVDAREAFGQWIQNPAFGSQETVPLFIVAAEGGGLRASVMTAMVLDELRWLYYEKFSFCKLNDNELRKEHNGIKDDELRELRDYCMRVPLTGFNDHLFAVIGVSGGSLGAATYAAAVHESKLSVPIESSLDSLGTKPRPGHSPNWQAALHADLLTPTVRSLLGPDLLARFVPNVPNTWLDLSAWDRARTLEDAWANGWEDATGDDALGRLWFRDLGPRPGKPAPYLILMTTSVRDGTPMAISHLNGFGIRTLSDIRPNIDVPLTTAAVMSARFPVITPPARLPDTDPQDGYVDGGYYENSGITAATRLIQLLLSQPAHRRVAITLIRIENGGIDESTFFGGLPSPFTTLVNTRQAHDDTGKQRFDDLLKQVNAACPKDNKPCLSQVIFRLSPDSSLSVSGKPLIPVPLGWLLNPSARGVIAGQLSHGYGFDYGLLSVAGVISGQLDFKCNDFAFARIGASLGSNPPPDPPKSESGRSLECGF